MLIGIAGRAGAGKDTVADYMVSKYGYKRYAFADAVRDVALAVDPMVLVEKIGLKPYSYDTQWKRLSTVIAELGWDTAKRGVPEVRRLLQVIGTEAGRMLLGENVWVDIVFRKWQDDGYPDAVVTDMRFPNEFAAIDGMSYPTLNIVRPDNPNAITPTHASEAHEFKCDYTVVNDGTIEDLHKKIDHVIELIGLDIGG